VAAVSPVGALDIERLARIGRPLGRASDRRAHARLATSGLSARLKYGERVTLVDVSVGGALVETTQILRPDTNLVLEILDARARDATQVIARVLRAHVAGIDGAIRYRGACQFKRPLSHPTLAAAPAPGPLQNDGRDFLKLELALKTIVEACFRPADAGAVGRWRTADALLAALARLRAAAERRNDLIHLQLVPLLTVVIAALQQRTCSETIAHDLQALLARELPLLAIRAGHPACASGGEMVTFGISCGGQEPRVEVTAEFPAGFTLDDAQFRLLKAGAYLVALVRWWRIAVHEEKRQRMINVRKFPRSAELPRRDPDEDPQDPPSTHGFELTTA
jgi:hypothetical protein